MIRALFPWLRRRATGVLEQRFGSRARGIVSEALRGYQVEAPCLPEEASLGGGLMVRCAALATALYRVLIQEGMSEAEARAGTTEVTAAIYGEMAEVPWALARLSSRSAHGLLKGATDVFRRFPFSEPAYRIHDVAADDRTVAFDVERCPVAEYFRARGLLELCVESFCNLDDAVAKRWGARLDRTTTLAAGGDRCDFRWRVETDRREDG